MTHASLRNRNHLVNITPNALKELKEEGTLIFVFGSNLRGAHGAGAAVHAQDHWGAVRGVGVGLSGNAYALPTKDERINTLPLAAIKGHVDRFKEFARLTPSLTYQVTQIGCGLAGFTPAQIAPLFSGSPDNCYFDTDWFDQLRSTANYWGHVG
jgi:hypothetical protein